jgi:hypothetical protein
MMLDMSRALQLETDLEVIRPSDGERRFGYPTKAKLVFTAPFHISVLGKLLLEYTRWFPYGYRSRSDVIQGDYWIMNKSTDEMTTSCNSPEKERRTAWR